MHTLAKYENYTSVVTFDDDCSIRISQSSMNTMLCTYYTCHLLNASVHSKMNIILDVSLQHFNYICIPLLKVCVFTDLIYVI